MNVTMVCPRFKKNSSEHQETSSGSIQDQNTTRGILPFMFCRSVKKKKNPFRLGRSIQANNDLISNAALQLANHCPRTRIFPH